MIPLLDLAAQYRSLQPEIDAALSRVLASGRFILGTEVSALETEVAAFLGVRHAVGVASGTDALILALRALDIGAGDEVIVPAYTFFATAGTVLNVGARPVFVDIDPLTYTLDVDAVRSNISPRTKAIIPVHLYGHPADMDGLQDLAIHHGLAVIEDNAQAFGAPLAGPAHGLPRDNRLPVLLPHQEPGCLRRWRYAHHRSRRSRCPPAPAACSRLAEEVLP